MSGVADETDATDAAIAPAAGIEVLHAAHYAPLVRLATLMLGDLHSAEEVVQDAFIRMFAAWDRVRDPSQRARYLQSAVMNGARNRAARRRVAARFVPFRETPPSLIEDGIVAEERHRALVDALRRLPRRQRECLALRFYLDLSEREIARTLGIAEGSVKTHTHRGLRALGALLEEKP